MGMFMSRMGLFVLCLIVGCGPSPDPLWTISGKTMGTTFQVKIARPQAHLDQKIIELEMNRLLQELDLQMSTYRPDSEIMQFNQSRTTDWVGISRDFGYVLNASQQISAWSGGAFDITVGPLVNAWGFGPDQVPVRIPSDDTIRAKMALVGYRHIEVDTVRSAVRKHLPEISCDLSAIAPGFGVDKLALYLESLGVGDYFVEIGGEVRVKGHNAQGEFWRVGISTPSGQPGIQKVVSLNNLAISTSGDYHDYFEKDGVRYSHTIDPATGRPITHKLASISVVHVNCTYADGLATAIDVMGPEKGFDFAIAQNLPVFMVIRDGDGFVEKMTPAFEALLNVGTLER
jgi:thiamine biosynthesis lipoprotein